MNEIVSFKVADFLVKKGIVVFSENCYPLADTQRPYPRLFIKEGEMIPAPSIADVVDHLYVRYRIWISVDNLVGDMFYFSHRNTRTSEHASREGCDENGYYTSKEAYEAAIIHTITKRI